MRVRLDDILKWAVRLFILAVASVFLCLPIMAAAHSHYSHIVETDHCEHSEHRDHQGSETGEDLCPQCEFYSRFVTKQADVPIRYAFDIPLTVTRPVCGWAVIDAPPVGESRVFINKGPPRRPVSLAN